jgi:hypothetical protein
MRYFDVFNGDADGICALHQLRLADPLDSTLVTGLKRDIRLLDSVPAGEGDVVTVLDISLDRNRAALARLLEAGACVRYFDHHYPGEVPKHRLLQTVIDDSGALCTSGLIDRHLRGRFRAWAIVGAFGDGMEDEALALAGAMQMEGEPLDALRELGESLNYNAYGETEADVVLHPAALYRIVSHYAEPLELLAREPIVARLARERRADLQRAMEVRPLQSSPACDAYVLPDAAWSRRVSGTFANRLAQLDPGRAHAVLTPLSGSTYVVSVRAPKGNGLSAADFCRGFPGGGGRKAAGGINRLEAARVDNFLDELRHAFAGEPG